MGDFSMACGATGLSLMNDQVVLIPIIRSQYWEESWECGGAHVVGNSGATSIYRPAALPIFGKLDCYGRVEEIERDANVEFLEKKLGVPIEAFAEACSTGLDGRDPNWEKILTALVGPKPKDANSARRRDHALRGMLVHRAAWEKMTSESIGESGKSSWSVWDDGLPTEETLKLLGFKFVKETKADRYNRMYTHPNIPGLVGMSDGTWTNFSLDGKKEESVYRISQLSAFLRRQGRRIPAKMAELAKKTPASLMWVMDKLSDDRFCCDPERTALQDLYSEAVIKKALKPGMTEEAARESMERYAKDLGAAHARRILEELYYVRTPVPGPLVTAMAKLMAFQSFLGNVNRLFTPTWNGPQYGNFHAAKALAELTARLAQARIDRYKE